MADRIAADACDEDFWRLWLHERDYFYKLCVRWLRGNRHDAEDVLSKAAITAALHIRDNPQIVQRFRPWMLRVLSNLCVDTLRVRLRGAAFERHAPARPMVLVGGAPYPLPDHSLLREELAASLEQAVTVLPPHLYQVFAMRFLEGLPYDRISAALCITQQTARKRIQLARERLRAELRAFA